MTYMSKRDQQRADWLFLIVVFNACHRVGFFLDISLNGAGVRSDWIQVVSAADWRSASRATAHCPPGEVASSQQGVKGREHVT